MMDRITRIENAGPTLRARRIFFDQDPIPRTTSAAVVKRLGIVVDESVERSELERRISVEEEPLARERALQLLGYRERSAAELLSKLRDGGYPDSVARPIVERYCEVELVDDARFAAAWARSRVAAGYGSRRIARELAEKGVAPEIITTVLEESCDPEGESALALRSLRGRTPRDAKDSQRLIRRLVARGFSMSSARGAVEDAARSAQSSAETAEDGDTAYDLQ